MDPFCGLEETTVWPLSYAPGPLRFVIGFPGLLVGQEWTVPALLYCALYPLPMCSRTLSQEGEEAVLGSGGHWLEERFGHQELRWGQGL